MAGAGAPQRRCAGCGRKTVKSELVRLALADRSGSPQRPARVVLDRQGRMPGRGAYICRAEQPGVPSASCLQLARRRGGIARALRCSDQIDIADIVESVSR